MSDSVADKAELVSSAVSLNRQSWAKQEDQEQQEPADPHTPLLRKHGGRRAGAESNKSVGQGSSASYTGLLNTEADTRDLYVTKTVFGEVRSCQRLTWVEWLFIVMTLITMGGVAGMSVERFVFIHNSFANVTADFNSSGDGSGSGDNQLTDCLRWTCLNDFTFALLALVNWAFSIYYCYDGLLRERPFEIIGYAFTIFIIFTFVVVNYFVEGEQGDVIKLARLVVALVLGPMNIVLAFVVQHRMGYLVFNMIGSNEQLTRAYHSRSLLLTLQKFNLQILANILVLSWVKEGHFTGLGEKVVLPLLLTYMLVLAYIGWAAVIWEIKPVTMVWIFLAPLSLGYYVFKIVNVAVHWSYYRETYTEHYNNGQATRSHFLYIAVSILFSCIVGLLIGLAMTLLMFLVMGNFGKGLKQRVPPPCCSGDKESLYPDYEDR